MLLLLVILLLGASALLAASETALFALARMQHTRASLGDAAARAVDSLLRRPLESLMVIIGFNEAINVFAECLATTFLLTWLGPLGGWISVPVMFVLVLLVCDITPKTFALGFPAAVARVTALPLAAVAVVFHPLARLFVPEEAPPAAPLSESEFKALLVASERFGPGRAGRARIDRQGIRFRIAAGLRDHDAARAHLRARPRHRRGPHHRRSRPRPLLARSRLSRQSQQHRRRAAGQGFNRAAPGVRAAAPGTAGPRALLRPAG